MSYGSTNKDGPGAGGDAYWLLQDTEGRQVIVGPAAEDAAAAGSPLLSGGRYDSTPRDLDDGDVGAVALDADARILINSGWTPGLQSDTDLNDSDKSFTVPASTEWRIQSIWIEMTTSADAGDRHMEVQIQEAGTDVIAEVKVALVQAESLTRYYLFAPHVTELAAFRDTDILSTIFPDLTLPAGYIIRIWDNKAIAAGADDMILHMMILARTV